jgi:hypothetical protein
VRKLDRTTLAFAFLALAPLFALSAPLGRIKELKPATSGVGRLFPESADTIRVVVRDERPADPVLIAGLMERALMGPALIGQYSDKPNAAAGLFEAAAKEAVELLGMKVGDGGTVLELTVRDFRVEWVAHNFGGVNVLAFGNLQTSLKSADGAELAAKTFRWASWDSSLKIPFPSVYARAAWEATARTLLAAFPKKAEPAAIQRVLSSLATAKEDAACHAVFWLGIAGADDPAAVERLFSLFRFAEDQTMYEWAALALARLGAPGAREEFEAVLSGAKKLKEWDPREDAEEAFTLVHALGILGVADLGAKIPPTIQRHRERLTDLVQFLATGEMPKMSPKLAQELTKAKAKKKL